MHILGAGNQIRHYTYGGDLARGIRLCIEKPESVNEDFNLSTPVSTSVLELAENIWNRVHGGKLPFRYVSDEPFKYDVQKRVPAVEKAERMLGFRDPLEDLRLPEPLDQILDEVMPWIEEQIRLGGI